MPLWTQRPESLKQKIATVFETLKSTPTAWGAYNGSTEYDIACVKTFKLVKYQIKKSPEQKIFNIMDIGAGDGRAGNSLAHKLNEDSSIPADVKINIFNIRAEQNLYDLPFHRHLDKCDIYECNGFNAENLIDELARIGHQDKQFDIIMSVWCMRHLVDPVGTFEQIYSITRPESGFVMMDGFWYQLSGHKACYKSDQNNPVISILLDTHSQFLVHLYNEGGSFNRFILRKSSEDLLLPLEYTSKTLDAPTYAQAGRHSSITEFKATSDTSVKWVVQGEVSYDVGRFCLGDKDLYEDLKETFGIKGFLTSVPSYGGYFERNEEVSLVAVSDVDTIPFCE